MLSIYKIILFFSFFFCSANTKASVVGLFDPYFILLFHPKMVDFDFGMQRFLKNRPNGIDELQWLSERKNMIQDYKAGKEQRAVNQTKAMQNFYTELVKLRRRGLSHDVRKKETAKLHKKHLGEIKEQLSGISDFYKSDEACLEIYRTMFRDVAQSIDEVRKKHNLAFLAASTKQEIPTGVKTLSHTFDFELSNVNLYWKIFPVFKRRNNSLDNQQLNLMLSDYIASAQDYESLLYPLLPHQLVLTNIQNQTVNILNTLYKFKNQKSNHAQIIGELYESWKKSNF